MTHVPDEHGPARTGRPELVVLDVNETLSDLSPLAGAFTEVGLDGHAVDAWFAGVLRDAFALTVLGENPSFAEIGGASLRVRLAAAGSSDPEAGAQRVMDRFAHLDPHPDVVPGLRAIAAGGSRIVTLSNGSAAVARALLEDTAAGAVIEDYLTVADAGAWKPAGRAYEHALATTSVPAARAMLVAVHPWDIAGARRAGLRTAWINRSGAGYPDHFAPADVEASSLVELATAFEG
jgi:2-haloacid dehalogenase